MKNRDKDDEFEDVIIRLYSYLLGYIFNNVRNWDEARDICQEVFTRYIVSMEKVKNPRLWLIGIARNVILEHYREINNEIVPLEDHIADNKILLNDELRELRIIFADLINNRSILNDDRDRELFSRIAINNKTFRSTGKELNYTETQVRYRYRIIEKRIRRELENIGIKSIEDIL